jgi:hypothetical protein
MNAERARIGRLRRIERVRAINKQVLTGYAADAERTLAQMIALAERTGSLAGDYAVRSDAQDGASLRQVRGFALGLQSISADTSANAQSARARADQLANELAEAQRRHSAIGERVEQQSAVLDRRANQRLQAGLAWNLNRSFRS